MPSTGTGVMATSARSLPLTLAGSLGWLLGLGLIALLIGYQGLDQITGAFALAGAGLLLVLLAYFGTLVADSLGWRALLVGPCRRSLATLLVKRWIGISVNGLLPVGQVGGDLIRARLLARSGVPPAAAGASVVVDITVGLVTLVAFALIGTGLLADRLGATDHADRLVFVMAMIGLVLLSIALMQQRGLFLPLAAALRRVGRGAAWLDWTGGASAMDSEIRDHYRHRRRLLLCGAWRLAAWLFGSLEVWVASYVLGYPISPSEAIILESLGQVGRVAGFFIPGGLGAQEGGIMLAAAWIGMPPEIALAAALLKRARELVYGVPGLIAWSLVDPRPNWTDR